jgi:hypothetical protein
MLRDANARGWLPRRHRALWMLAECGVVAGRPAARRADMAVIGQAATLFDPR